VFDGGLQRGEGLLDGGADDGGRVVLQALEAEEGAGVAGGGESGGGGGAHALIAIGEAAQEGLGGALGIGAAEGERGPDAGLNVGAAEERHRLVVDGVGGGDAAEREEGGARDREEARGAHDQPGSSRYAAVRST
jgi:hypothetical protein